MVHRSVTLQLRTTVCDSIAHRIALAGLASEKAAECAINQGEVEVDGNVLRKNVIIHSEADIRYKGQPVPMDIPTRLWGVKKPKRVICSLKSGSNIVTLRDVLHLQNEMHQQTEGKFPLFLPPHVNIVKSLESRFEGLVLMTNDLIFAQRLADPNSRIQTVYRMKVFGAMPSDSLRIIRNGAIVNGIDYGPVWVEPLKKSFRTTWIRLRLVEAPQRCLDTLMDYFKLRIMKAERIAFGPIRLENEGHLVPLPIPPSFRKFVPVLHQQFCMMPTTEALADIGELPSVVDGLRRHSAVKRLDK